MKLLLRKCLPCTATEIKAHGCNEKQLCERRQAMKKFETANRRSFLKRGMVAAGTTTAAGLLLNGSVFAAGPPTKGDIAILRFLNALEQIEADLWLQYSELGGVQDNEVSGVNGGNPLYTAALQLLDGDMPQYIHDNADDEISHVAFLNAFLESKGHESVNLDRFRTLPSSKA